ncbi:MAG: rsmG [Firmicutes bacterium]|nr:rsmG [Bacillota bacterium]
MDFVNALENAATSFGLEFSTCQIEAFRLYQELLLSWNEKVNLTAITKPEEVAVKHIIDSLACYNESVFFDGATIVDVGTGAGFPGLPLKIFRPELKVTLLDSLNKRLVFLQEVVDRLGLKDIKIVHSRAEDAGRKKGGREQYNVAVSRAVARLNVLAEYCLPFVCPGGYFVALKGAQYRDEITEAKNAVTVLGGQVQEVKPIVLPGISDSRAIIYISKVSSTPALYPRRPGTVEKNPL